MNAEELIIGHFEKTLTSEQESHLAALVTSSPEVRSLYEQHGSIHGLMTEEAETIETTSKLDKVVVGAALGTLVEIAGHGAVGFSLLGKVASVVGAIAVGGAGILLYNSIGNDDDAAKGPATTKPVPAAVQQKSTIDAPVNTDVDVATPEPTPSSEVEDRTDASASRTTTSVGTVTEPNRPSAARPEPAHAQTPPLGLGGDKDTAKIEHDPTVKPDSGK
jgi:hypothetical protein